MFRDRDIMLTGEHGEMQEQFFKKIICCWTYSSYSSQRHNTRRIFNAQFYQTLTKMWMGQCYCILHAIQKIFQDTSYKQNQHNIHVKIQGFIENIDEFMLFFTFSLCVNLFTHVFLDFFPFRMQKDFLRITMAFRESWNN